jgi:tRNA pseudouridine38-40 synthase
VSGQPGATGTRRWRLVVAYDGSGFHGFADQPGVATVAGALAAALARAARLTGPPPLVCAGRTDAGVHARGQVVHVDLPDPLPTLRRGGGARTMEAADLARALNRQLAPAVVVRRAEPAAGGFDARRSAVSRAYRYLIWSAPVPDPLLAPFAWHVSDPLDLRRMEAASDTLVGEHDFRAFCRRAPGRPADEPIVRVVTRSQWSASGPPIRWAGMGGPAGDGAAGHPGAREVDEAGPGRLLRFDIEAGSFCHQMVRSVVGEMVQVGRGRGTAASMMARLRAADRSGAADPAPPHGLCLVSVGYGEE